MVAGLVELGAGKDGGADSCQCATLLDQELVGAGGGEEGGLRFFMVAFNVSHCKKGTAIHSAAAF